MPTTSSTPHDNSAALSSAARRWFVIGGGGIAAVASLAAALAMSLSTPDDPDITSAVSLLGRLLICAIFFVSGVQKVVWPAWTINYITSVGLPFAPLGLVIGITVELGGGSALALGYHSRFIAALLVSYCVATAAFFHRDFHDENQIMNFFKNVAMTGGLLQIIALGAGTVSLDAVF
jgi:putative oxidoreductase